MTLPAVSRVGDLRCICVPCKQVLRRRRGLLHGQDELGEGGGGHARHIKLAVSVLLAMIHCFTPLPSPAAPVHW